MRVNPAFTGFFNNRLVVASGLAIVLFAIFFICSSFRDPDRDLRAKRVNLIIRQIGHRLLLQGGDSTSRVLPVTQSKKGIFLLKFEKNFVFSHDSLMLMSQGLLPKTQYPAGYTVTVQDCKKGDIVFGFQVNNTSSDILACNGRTEPPGCYTIEFDFPDFYANVEERQVNMGQLTRSTKELKAITSDFDINHRTEILRSGKADPREFNPKRQELRTETTDNPLMNGIFIGMLVSLCITLLIWRFRKTVKPAPMQNQSHAMPKGSVPELAALGKFLFDVKGQRLFLGSEVISLTDKECKVLELLHKNFGELIPRETLMQEVWINEGVITGRSLDMFVSKLRKKLSGDPELRITNVHGKGYKLEISEGQIIKDPEQPEELTH
jgi:DNA-binding winged helix-turn-helix (wHTH) protein